MSGGPVFARHSGWLSSTPDLSDGAIGTFYNFIGVYLGRIDDDSFSAQIGRVVRRDAVDEMLDANVCWSEDSGF